MKLSKKSLSFVVTLLVISTLPIIALSEQAATGPRETIEAADRQIRDLLSKTLPEGSPAAKTRDDQLRQVVTNLLDIETMSKNALGRSWDERTPQERQEYLTLMGQLVERSYLKQARNRTEYEISFEEIEIKGSNANVVTNLRFKTRGRVETIEVAYDLTKSGNTWRVVDILTDGSSTVRGYQTNFRRIITKNGFEDLMTRLRGRIADGGTDL